MPALKQGLGPKQHQTMLEMAKSGKSAAVISEWLQVDLSYVKQFVKPKTKPKPKVVDDGK